MRNCQVILKRFKNLISNIHFMLGFFTIVKEDTSWNKTTVDRKKKKLKQDMRQEAICHNVDYFVYLNSK